MAINARLLRPRATGFNPKSIASLSAWWDASDSATLFDATSGGSLPANNGAIGRWEDKSANQFHLSQGTANNRPIRKAAHLNGRDGIYFDGSNDVLYRDCNVFDTAVSLFVVVNADDTTSRRAYIDIDNRASASVFRNFVLEQNVFSTAGNKYGLYASNGAYDSAAATASGAKLFSVRANATNGATVATSTTYRVNGASYALNARTAATTFGDYTASSGVMIGAYNQSGAAAFAGVHMLGHFYEVIIYSASLSDSQNSAVERYLAAKWGITL